MVRQLWVRPDPWSRSLLFSFVWITWFKPVFQQFPGYARHFVLTHCLSKSPCGLSLPTANQGALGVNMTRAQARGLVRRLKSDLSIPRPEFADLCPIIIGELLCFQNLKPSYTQVLFVTNYLSYVSLQRSKNPCLTTSRTHTTLRTMPCVSYPPLPLAAAAALLQSCPTLCDPIDGSPPGSSVPGILQARTLEWAAISFSPLPLTVPAKCSLSP